MIVLSRSKNAAVRVGGTADVEGWAGTATVPSKGSSRDDARMAFDVCVEAIPGTSWRRALLRAEHNSRGPAHPPRVGPTDGPRSPPPAGAVARPGPVSSRTPVRPPGRSWFSPAPLFAAAVHRPAASSAVRLGAAPP